MGMHEIIKNCEELYLDIDLSYVKEWKKKTGSKAVGFLPVYVPREFIHAAGMLPVGLLGCGSHLDIIKGDAFFQSYICHIPRSTIELAVTKRLDCIDGFLFPAICDVIRNLSGMFQSIMEDKYIKFMDYPQDFSDELGGTFYQTELRDLMQGLSKLSGKEITMDDLKNSIKIYNENRKVVEELYQMRSVAPHLVSSYELYILMRAGYILEVSEHTQMLRDYMEDAAKNLENKILRDNVRVVVTGTFCEQPPLNLIKSLEQSGCYIVDDDWVLSNRYIEGDIENIDDPIKALATVYMNQAVSCASRYEEKEQKGKYLLRQIKSRRAEGAIFCAPSFCDPALLERPMLQAVLKENKIPYTSIKYAENTGQFQVLKEQAGTFADSIKLWSEA